MTSHAHTEAAMTNEGSDISGELSEVAMGRGGVTAERATDGVVLSPGNA